MALLAALISVVLMTTVVAPRASSQPDPSNVMKVECKLLLSGLTSVDGSGSVELTFAGDPAVALRTGVFTWFDANGDMWLDANETGTLLNAFSNALVGKIYWGMAIKSATNFTGRTSAFIADHSSGLVRSEWNATLPIVLKVDFDGSGKMESKVIETAQGAYDVFAVAIADVTGYSYAGAMVVKQRITTIMLGSLSNAEVSQGSLSAIRNPFGEVLWYSFSGSVGPSTPAQDTMSYEAFSVKENQQVSFIVLFFGCLTILRMPGSSFDKFEKLHPKKFRKNAKRLKSVSIFAFVLVAVLVVLYFVPYIFSFASPNALVYAAYLYLLVPLAIIAEHLFAKSMYNKAVLSIPDESVVEVKQALIEKEESAGEMLCKVCYMPIEAGLDMFRCTCDAAMHVNCAEKAQTCPICGEPLFPSGPGR